MEKDNGGKKNMKVEIRPNIIVITGAESTGKSLLANQLGEHFKSPWFPEYAREYLERNGPGYGLLDIEEIAHVQIKQYEEALQLNAPYVFFDTWLIITKVWFEVMFGKAPEWIISSLNNAQIDLFLLCDTDLPWIPDPLRENGGEMRQKLHNIYLKNLGDFGFKFRQVSGFGEQRFQNALQIISETL